MDLSVFFTQTDITVPSIVIPMFVGAMIAVIIAYCSRKITGKFIQKLIAAKAETPESGRTLEELQCGKNILLRIALRSGSLLRSSVLSAEDPKNSVNTETMPGKKGKRKIPKQEKKNKEPLPSVTSLHFYIPEEKQARTASLYGTDGSNLITLILALLILAAAGVLVLRFLPKVLSLLRDAFTTSGEEAIIFPFFR